MLSRHPDWPTRLHSHLYGADAAKFKYGEFDCFLFVADVIEAMTGTDIAAPFRGRYNTRRTAFQVASGDFGATTVEGIAEHITATHHMPEVTPSKAMRGDLILIERQKGRDHSFGVVGLTGKDILIAIKSGFGPVPMTQAYRAWHV
jgi:hypothetical protein